MSKGMTENKPPSLKICVATSKEKYALHLEVPMMSPHQIESDCCPNCKRLIIDASDYENNLG